MDTHGVHVYLAKIQAIQIWLTPMTLRELLIFPGLANFYHRFVLGFSNVAWSIIQVKNGGSKDNLICSKKQKHTYEELKKCLCSSPVLSLLDLKQPFEIEKNASNYVIGVVLSQHGHLVGYHNDTLLDTVWKYSTYEKELYSIVQSFCQYKHEILKNKIVIHNDHNPL